MDKKVDLKKDKLDKFDFLSVFDSEFRELGIEEERDMSFFDSNLASIDDLFSVYERLFLEIPKKGDLNSHEYLAKTSGEYAEYEKVNEEINELIDEINELRNENLKIYKENINYQTRIQELEAFIRSNNLIPPDQETKETKHRVELYIDPPFVEGYPNYDLPEIYFKNSTPEERFKEFKAGDLVSIEYFIPQEFGFIMWELADIEYETKDNRLVFSMPEFDLQVGIIYREKDN